VNGWWFVVGVAWVLTVVFGWSLAVAAGKPIAVKHDDDNNWLD
jgi:hypothetical protein